MISLNEHHFFGGLADESKSNRIKISNLGGMASEFACHFESNHNHSYAIH